MTDVGSLGAARFRRAAKNGESQNVGAMDILQCALERVAEVGSERVRYVHVILNVDPEQPYKYKEDDGPNLMIFDKLNALEKIGMRDMIHMMLFGDDDD
jgi:hypothetical protein